MPVDRALFSELEERTGIRLLTVGGRIQTRHGGTTIEFDEEEGARTIAGEDIISLSWDRSRESDLASYRVWRRPAGAGEYELLTPEGSKETSYTDSLASRNTRYEYVVTALDQKGNESRRSDSVTAIITGGSHEDLPI